MLHVLPADASCEDIEVDEHLSFLDAFVTDALRKGAKRYVPPAQRRGFVDGLKLKDGEMHGPDSPETVAHAHHAPWYLTGSNNKTGGQQKMRTDEAPKGIKFAAYDAPKPFPIAVAAAAVPPPPLALAVDAAASAADTPTAEDVPVATSAGAL